MSDISEFWTAARVKSLKDMVARGGMSCTQMAEKLGATRNMVIGKIYRMEQAGLLQVKRKAKREKRLQDAVRVEQTTCTTDNKSPGVYSYRPDCCQWPLGDPKKTGYRVCGDMRVVDGRSYCQLHCEVAHARPDKPKVQIPVQKLSYGDKKPTRYNFMPVGGYYGPSH